MEIPRDGVEWKDWRLEEIPTVAAFNDGRELARANGAITQSDVERLLKLVVKG